MNYNYDWFNNVYSNDFLKINLKYLGLTQKEFAAKINVSDRTFGYWKKNKTMPYSVYWLIKCLVQFKILNIDGNNLVSYDAWLDYELNQKFKSLKNAIDS